MSLIQRMGNLAKGTIKSLASASPPPDHDAGPPAPLAPRSETAADPFTARRDAVLDAHRAGVLTEAERDAKLAAIEAERSAPPQPRPRRL